MLYEHDSIARSTYYDARAVAARLRLRHEWDEQLKVEIAVHAPKYGVYEAREMWLVDLDFARCRQAVRAPRATGACTGASS